MCCGSHAHTVHWYVHTAMQGLVYLAFSELYSGNVDYRIINLAFNNCLADYAIWPNIVYCFILAVC